MIDFNECLKVDFKPLEYIEVEQGKPLIIKIPSEKYYIKTNLQTIDNFLRFVKSYKIILQGFQALEDTTEIQGIQLKKSFYMKLIELVYKISHFEYEKKKEKKKYKKFLLDYYTKNIEEFIEVFTKILEYNSQLVKKFQALLELNPWQGDRLLIAGEQPLSECILTDENGKKYLKPRYSFHLNMN